MKKHVFLWVMILAAGLMITSCKQGKKTEGSEEKSEVPAAVLKAFQGKFAQATHVKWESEEEGEYEAEFQLNGKEMSAEFSGDGTWKETETMVPYASLPSSVMDTLSVLFRDYKVPDRNVEKTETPEGTKWEVKLTKDGKEVEVTFADNGKVLKKESEEEGDEVGEAEEGSHEKGEKEEENEEKEEH